MIAFIVGVLAAFVVGVGYGRATARLYSKVIVQKKKEEIEKISSEDRYISGYHSGMEYVVNELYGFKVAWLKDEDGSYRSTEA